MVSNIPPEAQVANNNPWWTSAPEHLATRMFSHLTYILRRDRSRSTSNITYFKLQDQQPAIGPSADSKFSANLYDRLTLNIIKQTTESLGAKLAQEEVKGMFMTESGNFRNQNNAKKLERFIDGQIYLTDHHNKAEEVFLNAATFGRGYLKSFIRDGRISTEWVLSEKIKFDEDECLFGEPQTMYQVDYVDKDSLLDRYPQFKTQIMQAAGVEHNDDIFFYQLMNKPEKASDYVRIVEGWRLGHRHTIAIQNQVLFDEPYPYDYFPFSSFYIYRRLTGVWQEGIAERLIFNQFEINKTLRSIGKIIHIGCVPKVFVDASGDIRASHFTNNIGEVIKYTGQRPEYGQLLKVPPELWEHLNMFIKSSFQEVGLNEMMVTGNKPQGTYSAKAQSEYLSVVEGRLFSIIKNWQRFHMETYKLWIRLLTDSQESVLPVTALGSDGFEMINWKEIEYDEKNYVFQMYAGNLLSKHPATKRGEVSEMVNIGLFDRDQAMDLLDYPDIKRVTSQELAPHKLIEKIIVRIIEKGEVFRANENLFIEVAVPMVTKAVAYYETMDFPPETLPLLKDFRDELVAYQVKKIQEQQAYELSLAQAGMAQGGPGSVRGGGEESPPPENQAMPQG